MGDIAALQRTLACLVRICLTYCSEWAFPKLKSPISNSPISKSPISNSSKSKIPRAGFEPVQQEALTNEIAP